VSGGPWDSSSEMFHPPPEPPSREKWERDEDAKDCRLCDGQFGMVRDATRSVCESLCKQDPWGGEGVELV